MVVHALVYICESMLYYSYSTCTEYEYSTYEYIYTQYHVQVYVMQTDSECE